MMNCFDWQNRVSDYLDGTLASALKVESDEHLEQCKECSDRYKHYRMILSSIASQPRSSLPIPIRRSPLSVALPRLDVGRLSRSRWEQVPWYLRTTVEGVGIVAMILLGISTGPKIRAFYERRVERSLTEFNESFNDRRKIDDPASVPLARGNVGSTTDVAATQAQNDDYSGGEGDGSADEEAADSSTETAGQEFHVGNSEIWRFILKTDSPYDIRTQVVKMLTDLKIPPDTPGIGGIEAPGGIQFDLIVPQSVVLPIKRQLQLMAPKPPAELAQTPAGETFTWYKNKSKHRVPEHKTRVVIWLSQM